MSPTKADAAPTENSAALVFAAYYLGFLPPLVWMVVRAVLRGSGGSNDAPIHRLVSELGADPALYAFLTIVSVGGFTAFALVASTHARAAADHRARHERCRTTLDAVLGHVATDLPMRLAPLVAEAERLATGKAGPINDRNRVLAENILREGREIERLLAQYHTFARLESGQPPGERKRVDFRKEVLSPVISGLELLARNAEIKLQEDPGVAATIPCLVDPEAMRMVIGNLLANAIHYGPKGSVIRHAVFLEGDTLSFHVLSPGDAITDEEAAKLFKPFSRLARHDGLRRGTGLGLHLARALVKQHAGEISVKPKPGVGNDFRVRLPGQPDPGKPAGEDHRPR